LGWVVSSEYWGRGFDENPPKEDAVIEIHFTECGDQLYATHKDSSYEDCPSRNQPLWCEDSWEDWKDHPELIKKYYNKVCK